MEAGRVGKGGRRIAESPVADTCICLAEFESVSVHSAACKFSLYIQLIPPEAVGFSKQAQEQLRLAHRSAYAMALCVVARHRYLKRDETIVVDSAVPVVVGRGIELAANTERQF